MSGQGLGEGYHRWIEKAEPEEQGSFCNLQPGRFTEGAGEHIINTDTFTAEVAERTAQINGTDTIRWSGDEDIAARHNHLIVEKDNNLLAEDEFREATYGPGK